MNFSVEYKPSGPSESGRIRTFAEQKLKSLGEPLNDLIAPTLLSLTEFAFEQVIRLFWKKRINFSDGNFLSLFSIAFRSYLTR